MRSIKWFNLNLRFSFSSSSCRSGFTLIEILVAIAIMAIVFGFIITSAGSLQRKARDQQRISDLQRIQAGLAQYYADNHYYPLCLHPDAMTSLDSCTGNSNTNCQGGNPGPSCTPSRIYLPNFPHDPEDNAAEYHYCYASYTQYTPDSDAGSNLCFPGGDVTNCRYYKLYAPTTDPSATTVTCHEDRSPHTQMIFHTDPRGT